VHQPEPFKSDRQRILIILNNLISNAIRYSYDNAGAKDHFIKIEAKISSQKADLEISDNGTGIKQEHLDRVFEMFYRADLQKSGSGLGLYIVKETLDKLHGTIEINSKDEEGTQVLLTIPNLISPISPGPADE